MYKIVFKKPVIALKEKRICQQGGDDTGNVEMHVLRHFKEQQHHRDVLEMLN